ncbi:MAG: DUF975 family protein [Lachnospiraceae bacterium]|nr:DUF975 family protein [Lachnospiraceae bacterium]
MWTRSEVKAKGKDSFKRNYWPSVFVAIIYYLFYVATGSVSRNGASSEEVSQEFTNDPDAIRFVLAVLAVIGVVLIVIKLVDLFLLNPLEVGCNRFFLVNQDEKARLSEMGHTFKNNYGAAVLGLFLRDLFIGIGVLLFIVPGLILSYSYRMVPYILAEDREISATEALKRSREMMKGQKWSSFVYDISFILWDLLSLITFGIVAVLYVRPYKLNADAALYQAIKRGRN